MPRRTDNDMVNDINPHGPPSFADRTGSNYVSSRWCWIPSWVIMSQNQVNGTFFDCALYHLSWKNWGFCYAAFAMHLVAYQAMTSIQIQNTELFGWEMRQLDVKVVEGFL